jgi:parvulin-like peptidyl-prolyl isomerase
VNNIFAQDESTVVAKVGNQIITVEEFRERYEFMPHLNYSSDNKDTLKKEFLYSLIAEKLWALEGLEKRIDTLDVVRNSLKTLEKLFVKDELFRREVESKIKIAPEEISKGLLRVARTLYLKIITSSDSSEIFRIYNHLVNFNNFDSLLAVRPEYNSQQKPLQIKLGTLSDEYAEDVVFNLRINEISAPMLSNNNWFIFKLENEEIDSTILSDNETARNKTISILSERKRKALAGKFLDKVIGGRTISANSELFNLFADTLVNIIQKRIDEKSPELSDIIELKPDDLQRSLKLLDKEKLNSLFVEFDSTKLSLKDFIYYLMYQKVSFPSTKSNRIKLVLNKAVKQFIEDEVITQEGYKRGLNKLSSVRKDINIWKNYYLSELMLQTFNDSVSVSDSEVENYLSQKLNTNSSQLQLNIAEIFTPQLDDLIIVIDELNKGSDFTDLAKKYNQREYTKKSNGQWGYFPANSAGQIGNIASNLEVGQIYGPIKVENGYSIIKLIDKKVLSDSLIKMKEEPVEYIKMKLSLKKINDLINKNTAKLALKYKITIDEKLLNEIELSDLNTFTYRLIGFGGKIAAMPITIPVFEWYYLLKEQNEIP